MLETFGILRISCMLTNFKLLNDELKQIDCTTSELQQQQNSIKQQQGQNYI